MLLRARQKCDSCTSNQKKSFEQKANLVHTMSLRVRNIKFAYAPNDFCRDLGVSFGPARYGEPGRIECKIFCSRMRGLSGTAPADDEIELIAYAAQKNGLAWLDMSNNKIRRIPKLLCELINLQFVDLSGDMILCVEPA
jgi:Leucine-rich repeat (LRR) protein